MERMLYMSVQQKIGPTLWWIIDQKLFCHNISMKLCIEFINNVYIKDWINQFFCKCVQKTLHVSSFNLDTSHDDITDGNKCSIWPCTFIFYLLSMQYIHQIVSKYYPWTLCSTMIFPINSYELKKILAIKAFVKIS